MPRDINSPTILIAEDDTYYCNALSTFFTGLGYRSIPVHNGNDALQALVSYPVDVVIWDFHLPGEAVDAIIEEMRTSDRNIAMIIITGDDSIDAEKMARQHSPLFYFVKPFRIQDLKSVIDNFFVRECDHESLHHR